MKASQAKVWCSHGAFKVKTVNGQTLGKLGHQREEDCHMDGLGLLLKYPGPLEQCIRTGSRCSTVSPRFLMHPLIFCCFCWAKLFP